jgi:hypothetical protein
VTKNSIIGENCSCWRSKKGFNHQLFGDQSFMVIERHFNHHKVYNDQNYFIFIAHKPAPSNQNGL